MRGVLRTAAWDALLPSEGVALRMAREGDRSAFDLLVKMHAEPLRAFVQKRVPLEAVDDIVQETWIAAWGHLDRFSAKARFRTWVYAISANKCRDWHRGTRPSTSLEEAQDLSSEPAETHTDIMRALQSLANPLREVLDLYYFEGLTLREIAEVTATNLNTVKYRFYRGHRELADALGDWNA